MILHRHLMQFCYGERVRMEFIFMNLIVLFYRRFYYRNLNVQLLNNRHNALKTTIQFLFTIFSTTKASTLSNQSTSRRSFFYL